MTYGTAFTSPDYSDFTDAANWNDFGVVVLDKAIKGITPARLAPLGYLDQFTPDRLNSTLFTLVGNGTEVRKADGGPQILQVNGNGNDNNGTGGTCFGDSGGPAFQGGYIVTVTSYGYTSNCRYIDGLQRVDIPKAQQWLAGFSVKPATP